MRATGGWQLIWLSFPAATDPLTFPRKESRMVLTTGLFVCALLATEIAGALYLAKYVRTRRTRR